MHQNSGSALPHTDPLLSEMQHLVGWAWSSEGQGDVRASAAFLEGCRFFGADQNFINILRQELFTESDILEKEESSESPNLIPSFFRLKK